MVHPYLASSLTGSSGPPGAVDLGHKDSRPARYPKSKALRSSFLDHAFQSTQPSTINMAIP